MNPIGTIAHAITHPVRSVGSVASRALGLAAVGAKFSARAMDWGANRLDADQRSDDQQDSVLDLTAERSVDATPDDVPAADSPVTASSPRRSRAAGARRAPSAKAATAGPAVAEVAKEEGTDPGRAVAAAARSTARGGDTVQVTRDEARADAGPLLDPSVAKDVRSESETLRKAADPRRG